MKARPEVLNVFPDQIHQLHTTRSPQFLGILNPHDQNKNKNHIGLLRASDYGSNVIIGVLDTGIWPERESFHDRGLRPVPSHWAGHCDKRLNFTCNRKIIGARVFLSGTHGETPRDFEGHGTHTASTAAGRTVKNASFFGYGFGTATGIASKARLAIYKICSPTGCSNSDFIAGLDAAVRDGVDIISLSLGSPSQGLLQYNFDPVAIATFGAIDHGVFVSASLGTPGVTVKKAGGVGMVLANENAKGENTLNDAHVLPAVQLNAKLGHVAFDYLSKSPNPKATIVSRGTQVGVKPAPILGWFSSRGPNLASINILKPDLIAPGVYILAAWPDNVGPTMKPFDKRKIEFNIISGTSMSCPHVSGVAALLKGAHRDWSTARIRSAMMTTSYVRDNVGNLILDGATNSKASAWGYGSGHVDPEKAIDPGLVFDLTVDDYVQFLCGSGYSKKDIHAITRRVVKCSKNGIKPWDLNYPSIRCFSTMMRRRSLR
ncbi:hypothetical protein Syun_028756 [Stephania yunnanensis]|uniref:Peptidase S8/S53 domain-containing protein n=1 Tax=Stephania yunnanensis TaxID=152371 RepID=A0AAP0E7P9_9MAGN